MLDTSKYFVSREKESIAHCHVFETLFVHRRITLMEREFRACTRIRCIADDNARYCRANVKKKAQASQISLFDLCLRIATFAEIMIGFSTIARVDQSPPLLTFLDAVCFHVATATRNCALR